MIRASQIKRDTKETNINLSINLDGDGVNNIKTEIGFFNHMLTLMAFHSDIDIKLEADGDLDVCDHHLIEDTGICIGKCIKEALGDKKGIKRYSTVCIPMDEALVMVSLDISGRAFLHFEGDFKRESIGNFSVEMVQEFFRALAFNAEITLHIKVLYGENDHHKIEGIFKAFGRALKEAIRIETNSIPSSKGCI
ncbi:MULTISPECIES: imidazoleglycerol-phosphate dehydratase HisB [unclassified Clostridium]|uniref:imidazoleglycerol-phosphate dehydratase HisB n=1 Tax=unclassified Clostridium TaxID=2614128 RepID=UPI00189C143A|nr:MULTISPECIES: imidazoleglycerol-phosphate dehydratase HisB [unclassified Clostridium]MBP3916674.1 imidazoleglycerol-phosphate dehydratase HisB [Clostridium sp.]MEE0933541.1 imidazoleglycerol-phosphate dehydratase HisB [Clostridium sp.]